MASEGCILAVRTFGISLIPYLKRKAFAPISLISGVVSTSVVATGTVLAWEKCLQEPILSGQLACPSCIIARGLAIGYTGGFIAPAAGILATAVFVQGRTSGGSCRTSVRRAWQQGVLLRSI